MVYINSRDVDDCKGHDVKWLSLGHVLTILAMFGAMAGVWGTLNADNADTKRRVTAVEAQQLELKQEIRQTTNEIRSDVKDTKQDIQLILRKLDAMEVRQQVERRERVTR